MTRLNDTVLKAELRKLRTAQAEIVDGAVPGHAVRVGRGAAATWSPVLRVRGEGGCRGAALRKKAGATTAESLQAARARGNEFLAQTNAGKAW